MLTISGKRGLKTKLSVPNNNVRVQLYNYLLEEYQRIHLNDIAMQFRHHHLVRMEEVAPS